MKKMLIIGIIILAVIVIVSIICYNNFSQQQCLGSAGNILYIDSSSNLIVGINSINTCAHIDQYYYVADLDIKWENKYPGNIQTDHNISEVTKPIFAESVNSYNKSCSGCILEKSFVLN
jgi:hypothetical protein